MPMMYPALGRGGPRTTEMKVLVPFFRVMVGWGGHREVDFKFDVTGTRQDTREVQRKGHPAQLSQEVMCKLWL